jgi:hypothetical protein
MNPNEEFVLNKKCSNSLKRTKDFKALVETFLNDDPPEMVSILDLTEYDLKDSALTTGWQVDTVDGQEKKFIKFINGLVYLYREEYPDGLFFIRARIKE